MIYLKIVLNILYWMVLFVVSNVINLLAYVLGPVIALSSLNKENKPWRIFWAFETHDNPIDGEPAHWERWPGNNTWAKLKRRTAWLWRNKGYNFDYHYLGRRIGDWVKTVGNPDITDGGADGYIIPGVMFQYDSNGVWEMYLIYPYPIKTQRCLRLRWGWKLNESAVGTGERFSLATSIGLWKSYRTHEQYLKEKQK